MTKSLTNDSRRGRCLIELSFLKAHRETYLQSVPVDGDNSFVGGAAFSNNHLGVMIRYPADYSKIPVS